MSDTYYFEKLLEQKKSFLVYGDTSGIKFELQIDWLSNKKIYQVNAGTGKLFYIKKPEELFQICIMGYYVEKLLPSGKVLEKSRNLNAEQKIIGTYIKSRYRERVRYHISKQNNKEEFWGFLTLRPEALEERKMRPVLETDSIWRKEFSENMETKRICQKQGYLITGYFEDEFYSGTMQKLAEYLFDYRSEDLGILYCENYGILQFQHHDYEKGVRRYWLL